MTATQRVLPWSGMVGTMEVDALVDKNELIVCCRNECGFVAVRMRLDQEPDL